MAERYVLYDRDRRVITKVKSGKVSVEMKDDGNFVTVVPDEEEEILSEDVRNAVNPLENRAFAAKIIKGFLAKDLSLKAVRRIFPKFNTPRYWQKSNQNPDAAGAFHKMDVNP